MTKGEALSKFARGRIIKSEKHGLSHSAIAGELKRSKAAVFFSLKNPPEYGTKKFTGRHKTITPALDRRIRREVKKKSHNTGANKIYYRYT